MTSRLPGMAAGVFGYSWVGLLHIVMGLSFKETLLLANMSSIAWLAVYHFLLQSPEKLAPSRQLLRTSSESVQEDSTPGGHVELASELPRDVLPDEHAHLLLSQTGGTLSQLPKGDRCAPFMRASRRERQHNVHRSCLLVSPMIISRLFGASASNSAATEYKMKKIDMSES